MSQRKSPNPIDVYVGSRVRLRRMIIGMSQEKLGEQLGLTFQQVQKYEKGTNRIGASRLYEISRILDVPVQFFFDGLPGEQFSNVTKPDDVMGLEEAPAAPLLMEFVASSEGLHLNRAYHRIVNPVVRRSVLELIRTLSCEVSIADTASSNDS